MRKIGVYVLIFLVLVVSVVTFFRGPIAKRVMAAGLERNLARDPFASLPDGLHVTLCGAGGPLPDPIRSGPCVAVIAGRSLYVVDAGSGAARSLAAVGLRPPDVDAVFLTHFHSDHIDGLGELGVLRWTGGSARSPLPVHGPEGVSEVTLGLGQVYRLDAGYRTAHHGPETTPPTGAGLRARPFVEPAMGESSVVFEREGLRVLAFRVDHPPISPAVGYRFEYAGRSVVISGDTDRSENLARAAENVDLLVHDALSPELMSVVREAAGRAGNRTMQKIAGDVLDYHATPVEVAETAEAVGADHLLFYHVVPPMPIPGLSAVFLDGVREAFSGDVTLGRDGTALSLPAHDDRIVVR